MGTREFRTNDNSIQKLLLLKQMGVERAVLLEYRAALDNIRTILSKLYEKAAAQGWELSKAEMTKYNRLTHLDKQITATLTRANSTVSKQIHRLTENQYNESFFRYAWAFDQQTGVALTWGVLSPEIITSAVENDLRFIALKRLRTDSLYKINRAVTQGLIRGASYPKMMNLIKGAINGTAYDALRIARTEGQRATALGSQAAYSTAAENGVEGAEIWDATLDGDTRPEHAALDQKKKDTEHDGWYAPGIGWVAGPLQSGVPGFDINCRCSVRYEVEGYAPQLRRTRDQGLIPYQTYDEWNKNK